MRIDGRVAAIALITLGFTAGPDTAHVAPVAAGPQEVEVLAVVLDPVSESPVVLLHGKRDGRRLAMTIGPAEATGIALPLRGVTPPRPLTHDLFLTLFGRLQVSVTRVVITDLRDGIYYATLHLTVAGADLALDSRPSDAIALAVRAKAPVLVEDQVFDKGGGAGPRRPQV
ncbi:MAG TPA: bifunctional nuclease family protein [Methylomirabilota bacterium]|nr:bifunctional nuclease family protein [Methylomirabilota bacterium]